MQVEVGRLEQRVKFSTGGQLSCGLLVLSTLVALVGYDAATTIFQQITAGVMWIGNSIIWCTGMIIGRRSTYTLFRERPARRPAEQKPVATQAVATPAPPTPRPPSPEAEPSYGWLRRPE